jgi:predicted small secreted protein
MKKLMILAVMAAALTTSACVTVIDAGDDDNSYGWSGQNAQPFDASLEACREYAGRNQGTPAFSACMAEKGWTRD